MHHCQKFAILYGESGDGREKFIRKSRKNNVAAEELKELKWLVWLGESQGGFFREVGVVLGWEAIKVCGVFLSSILFLPLSPYFLDAIPGKAFHLKHIFYYFIVLA